MVDDDKMRSLGGESYRPLRLLDCFGFVAASASVIEGWRSFVVVDCRRGAFFGGGLGTDGRKMGDLKNAVGDGIVIVSIRMIGGVSIRQC